jgi:hypothetical protein
MSLAVAKQDAKALTTLATEIRKEHEAAERDWSSAVEHAISAGRLLIEAKAKVRHGEWLPWLENNFPASEDTAHNYMRLARNSERVRNLEAPSIRSAIAELADRSEDIVDAEVVPDDDPAPEKQCCPTCGRALPARMQPPSVPRRQK